MGKGSGRRKEDLNKIRDNWDKIFGKKDVKEEKLQEKEPENTKSTKTK